MKKTVCIILTLSLMLTVFFCTPVFADYLSIFKTAYWTGLLAPQSGIIMQVNCTQFYPVFTDTYESAGISYSRGYSEILVTVKLRNETGRYRYCRNVGPTMYLSVSHITPSSIQSQYLNIVSVDNFSTDLMIAFQDANSSLDVVPGNDWSYQDGFIIPPYTTIYGVAVIRFYATSQATYSPSFAYLTGCSKANDGIVEITDHIPIGDHSDITNAVNAVGSYLVNQNYGLPAIESTLNDILTALNSSQSSNISNDSSTLKTQSDSVHSQEASYYAQNSQAIQSTGLSNYQFDNNAVSGLQGVRGDFIDVWNALGGWNAVYIFSLTLGLALTILRHSPSAISSVIKRRRNNGNG